IHLGHRHRLSHGSEIPAAAEESRRGAQPRRISRTNGGPRPRDRSSRLVDARPESAAHRAAPDPGACLSHGPFAGRNRGHNRMSGGNRESAHVSCAGEIAPVVARVGRRRFRRNGEKPMKFTHRSGEARQHPEISALIPWYVNGTLDEREAQRVEAHLALCAMCREDLAQERYVYRGMNSAPFVEHIPASSLKRLQAQLDGAEAAPPAVSAANGRPAAEPA